MTRERRFKRLLVNPEFVIRAIFPGRGWRSRECIVEEARLPFDMEVVEVNYDAERQCFSFVVFHESFDLVAVEVEAPIHEYDIFMEQLVDEASP